MERTARNKLENEVGIEPEVGFPAMSEIHYLRRLSDLHLRLQPKVYFEIGTESGASLAFSRCTSIAVDPKFRIEGDVVGAKPELHLFQGTSDAFFENGMLDRLGRPVDLAFLDGLHLFEVLLRDFINTERHMSREGLVVLHDCVPVGHAMAERQWIRRQTKQWTGDVWKLIPILRKYRPDLSVDVRDYAPTGLVEISDLDPDNRTLAENYDQIVSEFLEVSLQDFGLNGFADVLDLQRVEALPARTGDGRTIAIKIGAADKASAETWGDFHFANSLAESFRRLGYTARMDTMSEWAGRREDALDLILQGHDWYPAGPERPAMLWFIYPGKRFPFELLSEYSHVFAASEKAEKKLRRKCPELVASVLPQAFDPRCATGTRGRGSGKPVFVGNNHFGDLRQIVGLALESGCEIDIWGGGWEGTRAATCVKGARVENSELCGVYGAALAVLCDQTDGMKRFGIVSNRIYDALASGAPVITTPIPGLPERFSEFVHQVETPSQFAEAVAEIRAEPVAMRARRRAFAGELQTTDSFDARARTIIETAQGLGLL